MENDIVFSPEALSKGLKEIYDGLDVKNIIERFIFEETLRLFNEATAKGIADADDRPAVTDEFIEQLRTNNAVFSAFRTHRMQNDVARQLIDEKGKLKPFDRWMRDIKGMTDHYVRNWLQTEYSTAVIRAHQAADWKHFEQEADVLPNLRWMPTTSPNQDPLHRQYWEKKLTLPVGHPFWDEHRPGDRWNCKCSLKQTDEPANDEMVRNLYPVPKQPGLDNNPGKDGKLFADSHPYIANAYPGAKEAVRAVTDIQGVDFIPAESIKEAEEFAARYCRQIGVDRVFKGKVNYSGISVENANEINKSLKKVFDSIDIEKISGLKSVSPDSREGKKAFPSGADAIASYDPVSRGIYLNRSILKDSASFENYRKKSVDAWNKVMENIDKLPADKRKIAERYREAKRALVDDSISGAITHELGHHVQWRLLPADLQNGLNVGMARQSVQVSGYATSSRGEYLAESFTSWIKGERRIDYRLQDFLDSKSSRPPVRPTSWRIEETSSGSVRVSSDQGKSEIQGNIRIARYIAEKYNRDIDLIPNKPSCKSPDAFDKSVSQFNEYKTISTPTANAIDNVLRKAAKQADDIILDIQCNMDDDIIGVALKDRVRRSKIQSVRIIKSDKDVNLSRQQILSDDFTIKQDDYK